MFDPFYFINLLSCQDQKMQLPLEGDEKKFLNKPKGTSEHGRKYIRSPKMLLRKAFNMLIEIEKQKNEYLGSYGLPGLMLVHAQTVLPIPS